MTCDHTNPESWEHRANRAYCRACGRFMGYLVLRDVKVNRRQESLPESDPDDVDTQLEM